MYTYKVEYGILSNGETMVVLQRTASGVNLTYAGSIVGTSMALEVLVAIPLNV
jgi:hypothetical protein